MDFSQAITAFWWGGISAVSLPLGALLGLWLRPSTKWTSSLMSFGAGALLAALTLVLVQTSLAKAGFWPLGAGCIAGALLFMGLNSILNSQGAFLRKMSTTFHHLKSVKRRHWEGLLEHCANSDILRALPPEEVQHLLPCLRRVNFPAGKTIFKTGDEGDKLYIIETGEVSVKRGKADIATLGSGDAFGEMALIKDKPRVATVKMLSALKTWAVDKAYLMQVIQHNPVLAKKLGELAKKREDALHEMAEKVGEEKWAQTAKENLGAQVLDPTHSEIKDAHKEHGGTAMAIWLGILLDGIPESLVIGASLISTGHVSLALIVGVFLANFPEALSSSVGMKKQGKSNKRILWLWGSLTILTAVGAAVGALTFANIPPKPFAFVEGLAAGAMLAMIAETMLPEAAEQRGPANGLMTVLGFLAAVYVGTFGGH